MQEEPEIVKILRDEERLGKLQTKAVESTEESFSESNDQEQSQSSAMTPPPNGTSTLIDMQPDYLRALWNVMLHSVPIALLIFDEQEHLISWNDYAEKLLGDPINKFINRSMKEWYPAEEWQKLQLHLTEAQGLKHQINTKIYISTHRPIDVSISLCIVRDRNNKPIGTLHLLRELTSEPQVAQQMDAIVEYLDDSISLIDRQGRYLAVNNVPLYIDDFFKGRITVETSEFTVLIRIEAVVPMKEGVFPGYFLDDTVAVDEFIFHVTSPLER